jgi:pyruvate,water dikinase
VAADPTVAGAKAANLARAAATGFPTVPGFVITTAGVIAGLSDSATLAEIRRAHDELVTASTRPLVVRSSSVIEDLGESSMAGRFTSVLDVVGWDAFLTAVHTVIGSADAVRDERGEAGSMAVLVQRQLTARFGGVMFGVDPVTGSDTHVVVEVVGGGPDRLVSGIALADHYVLTRRGRVERVTRAGGCTPLDRSHRRALTQLARRAEHVFGSPQDVEWLVDEADDLWLLQSRPVTAVAAPDEHRRSVLLGPGPLAETFPDPLRPLEEDLWIPPLRDGIARALQATGAVSARALERSPVATTVGGWVAIDLELTGVMESRTSWRRRIDPLAILRRLGTAWRVGRLRVALPRLLDDAIATVDRDLAAVPRLDELDPPELAELLHRARRELGTVHAYEVLAGMLTTGQQGTTGAAAAVRALHDARAAGWDDATTVAGAPVVLVLTPPRLGGEVRLPVLDGHAPALDADPERLDPREALRVRVRWLQELLARTAEELGARLVADRALPDLTSVAHLRLAEIDALANGGPPPSDLTERCLLPAGPPLPVAFRLSVDGTVRPASVSSHRSAGTDGMPAGGARVVGVVWCADGEIPPDGAILVTRFLEPQLAPLLGRLTGLVSETGSALSHLAILAREAGLPTVVGVPDALRRFPPGTTLMIDGRTGDIEIVSGPPVAAPTRSPVP